MPIYNFTIDDSSPVITYDGFWSDSTQDNTDNSNYRNQTYHSTQSSGANASLTFNGTGVYLVGAKRSNHGSYSITLDGKVVAANGDGIGDELYNTTLFGVSDLPFGLHNVILTNTGAPSYLDLDYINITTGDGNPQTVSQVLVVDDIDHAFHYDDNWDTKKRPKYAGDTMHITKLGAPNSVANITFNGNAIKLYSATGDNHGTFSVSLDGAHPLALNGTSSTFRPQNLLCVFDGLPEGDHVLTVQMLSGTYLDLDQAIISTYTQSNTTAGPSPGTTHAPVDPSVKHPVPVPTIIGSSMGAFGLLVIMIAGWVLLIRARWNRARYRAFDQEQQRRETSNAPSDMSSTLAPSSIGFLHDSAKAKDLVSDISTQSEESPVVLRVNVEPPIPPHDAPPSYVRRPQSEFITSPRTTVFAKEKNTVTFVANDS